MVYVCAQEEKESFGDRLARIIINRRGVKIQKKVKIDKQKICFLIELGGDEMEGVGRDVAFKQEVEEHILRLERLQCVNRYSVEGCTTITFHFNLQGNS